MSQGTSQGMDAIDLLSAKIERGYRQVKDPEKRPILKSAMELLEAACVTGTGLTLNAVQTAALANYLEYHEAARELGLRQEPGACRREIEEVAPGKVVRFPGR